MRLRRNKQRLFDVLGLTVGERTFVTLELLGQFLTDNGQLVRSLDTNAHTPMTDLYDRDSDLVTDQDTFTDFSTEN